MPTHTSAQMSGQTSGLVSAQKAAGKAALARHLAALPQVDRYIFLMTYAEAMTCQEVACVLDWTEDRVRQRLTLLKAQAKRAIQRSSAGLGQQTILA